MDESCQSACELRELVAVPALTIRSHTSSAAIKELFDEGYREITACLVLQGLTPSGPPFAIYSNLDMEDFDVEFGFPVENGATGCGRIIKSHTPGGKAAFSLYIGPYNEIEPAYDALLKWIDDNYFIAGGTAYEIYLNDPAHTPPDMLKTAVHLLIGEA